MDIFLSYNSADHSFVENIAQKLHDESLEPFLDRWHLAPGMRWRLKLEETLSSCKAVAIFVGPGEMGSWQQREVDVALDLQSRNPKLPVIPVLLPGCEPPLGFLRQLTWVDLRTQTLDLGIAILIKAARGEPPGIHLQKHFDSVRAAICPYRGLLHFREEDAPFFFGREAAVDRLLETVQRQPFVAVVGASGSGKSSVVRAGLVTRLRSDRRTTWETVILVPTDQPLKALARALVQLLEPTLDEVDRLAKAARLAEHFRSGTISLYDIVQRILEKQSGTNRVLIVVDQFEELYTLTSDEEARRRFLDELLAASSGTASKANVALTLRGDFVGKALAYRSLSDRLQDAQINLGPMTREELECAIRKPAEKIQLEFEPGLVQRILNDVGDEPGNLPLLEFVLKELWEKRRGRVLQSETYDAIGGLKGAVATKADELFKGLSSAEQTILQRVFLRIVRPAKGGLDTRRRAAFTELPPEGAELILKLANERLLVTNQSASGQEQTVEVAHEALISNWGTLRAWVNEDREFLLWRDRLGMLLAEWEGTQESDEGLLRGPFLIEAQKWFDQRSQDLSDQEKKFISSSRALRERLAREERERQERALEAAQDLARAEAARAAEAERATQAEAARAAEAEKATQAEAARAAEAEKATQAEAARAAEAEKATQAEAARAAEAEKATQAEAARAAEAEKATRAETARAAEAEKATQAEAARAAEAEKATQAEAARAAEAEKATQAEAARAAEAEKATRAETARAAEAEEGRREQAVAAKSLRRLACVLAAVAIAAVGAAIFGFLQKNEAENRKQDAEVAKAETEKQRLEAVAAKNDAQRALTESFFRTIGVSTQDVLSQDEREALWELAQLDRANAAVRDNLLQRWFETQEAFTRGEALGGQGFRAATGLNLGYRRLASSGAADLGRRLVDALENSQETDLYKLWNLGYALAALAARMEPQAAAEIARRGATRLAEALENSQENYPGVESSRLGSLGDALAALAAKMEPEAIAEIAKGLAAALVNPQADPDRLSSLGDTLAALAAKIEPQAAAEIAKALAEALENPRETDSLKLSCLGRALAALAAKMEPQAAAEIARRGAQSLAAVLETDPYQFWSFDSALTELVAKMEPQAAAKIARQGALRLAAEFEKPYAAGSEKLWNLGRVFAGLVAKMEPQAAAEIAWSLAGALENSQETDSYRLWSLGRALAALEAKMEPQAAAEIARRGTLRLATALENPQERCSEELSSLNSALAVLPGLTAKMEPEAAAEIAKGLAAALENPRETDSNKLSCLGRALAALAAKMEPQAAAEIARRGAQRLAAALENPQETDSDKLSSLGSALAALATKMEPQAAAEIAKGLAAALENPQETNSDRLSSLGETLAAFCALLPSAHYTHLLALSNLLLTPVSKMENEGEKRPYHRKLLEAMCAQLSPQDLTEVLKYPFCTGEAEQIVFSELETKTGRKFGGSVWEFVEKADVLSIKDVGSPATRPSVKDALNELDKL